MKPRAYLLLLLLLAVSNIELWGYSTKPETCNNQVKQVNPISFYYKIIPSANHTWGYDIYKGGKMIIHQPSIPGMPGNNGFRHKWQAKKTARLVIEKIKSGEMPPTITTEELKDLKAI